jgi:hypothetical protein
MAQSIQGVFLSVGAALFAVTLAGCSCNGDDDGNGGTSEVGTYEGLFDGVVTGFNFPFDIAIVPEDPEAEDGILAGDILVASYGTSEVMLARDPSGEPEARDAEPFYAGPDDGLRGATAVSIPPSGHVWATFEQGAEGDMGAVAVLSPTGDRLAILDGAVEPGAFAHPGGICYGGEIEDGERTLFFMVNLGDGTAWRISVASAEGDDPELFLVGGGLATGTAGSPGTPGNGLNTSSDLPQGGARGCAYQDGSLYVADAQNARIVRFDEAHLDGETEPVALEDTPSDLVTHPTDVTINDVGDLIVISYDNAHAFVSLGLPSGEFIDNGLHDLNVNAGNYGTAVAHTTIWFTRANNKNGALRAITPEQGIPPSTDGPFPPQ